MIESVLSEVAILVVFLGGLYLLYRWIVRSDIQVEEGASYYCVSCQELYEDGEFAVKHDLKQGHSVKMIEESEYATDGGFDIKGFAYDY